MALPIDVAVGPALGLDASPPRAPAGLADIGQLIATRRTTHGDWAVQSATEQAIKDRLRQGPAWPNMSPAQRAAAEMIAVKLSRIVSGNPDEPDHWDDIAGYARLGRQGHAVADPVKDWAGHT